MQIIAQAPDLIETAQQQLPEASGLLDLPEHRFDHLLAQPVAISPAGPPQLRGHGAHQGHLRQPATPGCIRPAVTRPAWSEGGGDPPLLQRGQVRLAGKAGVARDLPRLVSEMGPHVVDERYQGALVGGAGHEPMRHDDLVRGIDRDLAVGALHEPVARGQDAAVGIREVPLRPVRWAAVLARKVRPCQRIPDELTFSFVPSTATWANCTRPAARHRRSTYTNRPDNAAR